MNHDHSIKKFYLIGNPVKHSLSPVMQNIFLNYYEIQGKYEALLVEPSDLAGVVKQLKQGGALGANITVPFKESIIPHLDVLSDDARLIGSVNALRFHDGLAEGFNTDAFGFQKSLSFPIAGDKIVLLGAGGAARGILTACCSLGCHEVAIYNRTIHRARKLIDDFQGKFPHVHLKTIQLNDERLAMEILDAKMIVNATSVGMKSHSEDSSPLKAEFLHKDLIVYDIIYNPPETKLIQLAKAKGCCYMNGLTMLIHQGLESLKIWIGDDLPFAESLIRQVEKTLNEELLSQ